VPRRAAPPRQAAKPGAKRDHPPRTVPHPANHAAPPQTAPIPHNHAALPQTTPRRASRAAPHRPCRAPASPTDRAARDNRNAGGDGRSRSHDAVLPAPSSRLHLAMRVRCQGEAAPAGSRAATAKPPLTPCPHRRTVNGEGAGRSPQPERPARTSEERGATPSAKSRSGRPDHQPSATPTTKADPPNEGRPPDRRPRSRAARGHGPSDRRRTTTGTTPDNDSQPSRFGRSQHEKTMGRRPTRPRDDTGPPTEGQPSRPTTGPKYVQPQGDRRATGPKGNRTQRNRTDGRPDPKRPDPKATRPKAPWPTQRRVGSGTAPRTPH
jgi:hypothetical protein